MEHVAAMEQTGLDFIIFESVTGRPRREGNLRVDGIVP
jgi:hypothetical protein